MSVLAEDEPDNRVQSVRSFAIGFALITLVYMIPVLAMVMWAIVGVLGLGSAALSFITAYRRENPKPIAPEPAVPPPAPAFVPPPPVPATYQYAEVSSPAADAPAATFDGAPPMAAAPAIPLAASRTVLAAMPKALFRDRLAAFVLDVILMLFVLNIFDLTDEMPGVFFLGLLVYHIGFWTWKQTTVGGIICQVRLTRVDGTPLSFADALVRGLASIFSLAVLGIGALWILKDPDNQAWHDKIAGTYVVKVPRNWPL